MTINDALSFVVGLAIGWIIYDMIERYVKPRR